MKKNRLAKVLLLTLAAAMALSMASCKKDKQPTAEDLIASVPAKIGAVDADMSVKMTATLSVGETEGQAGQQMDVKLSIDTNTKSDGTHTRTTGKSITEMLGTSLNTDLDTYADGSTGMSYNWDPELAKWTINTEAEAGTDSLGFDSFGQNFKNPSLRQEQDGDGNYVVDCDLDLAGMGMLNELSPDASAAKATAVLVFDGKTRQIKSVSIQALTDGQESTNEMSIELKFNQLGGDVHVQVPDGLPVDGTD